MQPYRFYWVGSTAKKAAVAKLCLGQMPAETASALVVAVADIGSMRATSRGQVEWMRRGEFSEAKIRDYERTAKSCENLMIAAEALGINTCPMEGFDGRRLSKYLGLSPQYHEIVMVIAMGKKSRSYVDPPQWRRPLDATVTVL